MADYYIFYTQARVCAYGGGGPLNTLLIEPIYYDQTSPNGGGGGNVTPAAATAANDTNVTLTLNGTPSTALLQAVQWQMGWTGALAGSRMATATASTQGALPAWPNNTTTFFRGDGTYATLNFGAVAGTATPSQLPTVTTSAQGAIPAWPNNTTTFFRGDGTYAALPAYPTGANPTATAGASANNGTSPNFMRADASPALALATNAVKGAMEGDGSSISCTAGVCSATGSGGGPQLPPGGRLVAEAVGCGTAGLLPVNTANVPNAIVVCLLPYVSNNVPINGVNYSFGSSQTLTPTGAGATNIYDIYEIIVAGSPVIAWDIAGYTGTPTNPKKWANGAQTNTNTIANLENNGSVIATSVTTGNATYLGSFYATATSQTAWTPTPTPAAGGTNNCICLYNAYNQVPVEFLVRDSVGTFTFGNTSGAWEFFDGNQNNEVLLLDGLGTASYEFSFSVSMSMDSANPNKGQVAGAAAVCMDCTITAGNPNNVVGGYGTQGGCGAWTVIASNANGGSACGTDTNGQFTFPGVGYGGGSLPTQNPIGLHSFALIISGENACTSCATTGPLWYGSIAGAFRGRLMD